MHRWHAKRLREMARGARVPLPAGAGALVCSCRGLRACLARFERRECLAAIIEQTERLAADLPFRDERKDREEFVLDLHA